MGVTAPPAATVSLVLIVVSAAMFTVGWRLAVARRYVAHRWVQTAAAALNAGVVFVWMIRSLVLFVAPEIPARLDQLAYATATVHAAVGVSGVVLGLFVVLRGNGLVPRGLRFSNYRPAMRISYLLYMLGTLSGVILYAVAYLR
jgi:uncharacterized membrane protein YozB (DUF420 family)